MTDARPTVWVMFIEPHINTEPITSGGLIGVFTSLDTAKATREFVLPLSGRRCHIADDWEGDHGYWSDTEDGYGTVYIMPAPWAE